MAQLGSSSCILVLLIAGLAEGAGHVVASPGIGLFYGIDGSTTFVEERPNGASVTMTLNADSVWDAPYFGAVWSADTWTRLDIVSRTSSGTNFGIIEEFEPIDIGGGGFPLPQPGEFMMIPPKAGLHSLVLRTNKQLPSCFDENLEPTCSGVGSVTYDVFAVPDPLPGDANFDDNVSFADFLILSTNYGDLIHFAMFADGDFDLSGTVDMDDFLILSQNFGATRQLAAVPEPCGLGAVFFASLSAVIVNRKRKSR